MEEQTSVFYLCGWTPGHYILSKLGGEKNRAEVENAFPVALHTVCGYKS